MLVGGELIWQWRQHILDMLQTSVAIVGEDDVTGEEYEERAALQIKLGVYLDQYTLLVQEWRTALTGERNFLYAPFFHWPWPRMRLLTWIRVVIRAEQLQAEIDNNERKKKSIQAGPNRAMRDKKGGKYVPVAKRRVPTLEQGGASVWTLCLSQGLFR